jgi:hypothetical protein
MGTWPDSPAAAKPGLGRASTQGAVAMGAAVGMADAAVRQAAAPLGGAAGRDAAAPAGLASLPPPPPPPRQHRSHDKPLLPPPLPLPLPLLAPVVAPRACGPRSDGAPASARDRSAAGTPWTAAVAAGAAPRGLLEWLPACSSRGGPGARGIATGTAMGITGAVGRPRPGSSPQVACTWVFAPAGHVGGGGVRSASAACLGASWSGAASGGLGRGVSGAVEAAGGATTDVTCGRGAAAAGGASPEPRASPPTP